MMFNFHRLETVIDFFVLESVGCSALHNHSNKREIVLYINEPDSHRRIRYFRDGYFYG